MLMPKRTKHRKMFKGRNRGMARRGATIAFGDYLYLPRNVPHAFRNPYDEESRVISVVSPAGLEAYYQALSEMPPGPMDFALVKSIMDDFGIEMDLPPGH